MLDIVIDAEVMVDELAKTEGVDALCAAHRAVYFAGITAGIAERGPIYLFEDPRCDKDLAEVADAMDEVGFTYVARAIRCLRDRGVDQWDGDGGTLERLVWELGFTPCLGLSNESSCRTIFRYLHGHPDEFGDALSALRPGSPDWFAGDPPEALVEAIIIRGGAVDSGLRNRIIVKIPWYRLDAGTLLRALSQAPIAARCESLRLEGAALGDERMGDVCGMDSLQVISVRDSEVTELGLAQLLESRHWQFVNAGGLALTPDPLIEGESAGGTKRLDLSFVTGIEGPALATICRKYGVREFSCRHVHLSAQDVRDILDTGVKDLEINRWVLSECELQSIQRDFPLRKLVVR